MRIKDVIERKTKRPTELSGWTWCIEFEKQKLFITINHDGANIVEVFATEMLSERLVSDVCRMLESEDYSVSDVIADLEHLTGTHVAEFDGKAIHSPEHAVAECLRIAEAHLNNLKNKITD